MPQSAKVDFVLAGAQKSGTRALRHFLSSHPDIGLMAEPEVHYFDRKILTDDSSDYAEYHAMYTPEALARVTGDFTPIYLYLRDVPKRLRAYNPDFKVIVILRNPVERAYSQWAMQREKEIEQGSFLSAILLEPLRYFRIGQNVVYSHVARGFYARQLKRLFAEFPAEQILVLRNEELSENHDATMRRLYRFLGLRDIDPPVPERVHERIYPEMPGLTRRILQWVYGRDIRRLEKMMGWDLSDWR